MERLKFTSYNEDGFADQFLKLMNRLSKEKHKDQTFWHNRDIILSMYTNTVIVTEGNNFVVGFYIIRDYRNGDTVGICFIQSFKLRCGIGTRMLEHIYETHEDNINIVCVVPLLQSYEFWIRNGITPITWGGKIQSWDDLKSLTI